MIPLLRPNPVSLLSLGAELRRIEDSGIFSNSGPANTRFERDLAATLFDDAGACVTVCNATLGLMLAIRAALAAPPAPGPAAASAPPPPGPRYALMPAFTFAAAAQAADWCGLTPLFCDSHPGTWSADPDAEDALLAAHGSRIAVILPYATFGAHIDLARYERIRARTGIPVVVDAAASLGSQGPDGRQFGTGSPLPTVFSMHATKAFSTAEGGVVHSADRALIARIRAMANFGFEQPRIASLPGLNAKLSEVHAILASAKLAAFEPVMERRQALAERYRERLPGWRFQHDPGRRSGCSIMSVLLPRAEDRAPDRTADRTAGRAPNRAAVIAALAEQGIGAASYFSPHAADHPLFASCPRGPLPVADDIAARVLSLPIWDGMRPDEVDAVCGALGRIVPIPAAVAVPAVPAPDRIPCPAGSAAW